MKKMMMALVAAMMLSTAATAQDGGCPRKDKTPRMNKTEMVQRRTDAFAQRYGLDDQQKAKLLKLNTEYADKMPMMRPRHGGPRGQRPDSIRHCGKCSCAKGATQDGAKRGPKSGKDQGKKQGKKQGNQTDKRPDFKAVKANRVAYEKELKAILTDEQLKKWQSDRKQMQKSRPQKGKSKKGADI